MRNAGSTFMMNFMRERQKYSNYSPNSLLLPQQAQKKPMHTSSSTGGAQKKGDINANSSLTHFVGASTSSSAERNAHSVEKNDESSSRHPFSEEDEHESN